MMEPARETRAMIAAMRPRLTHGVFVFCSDRAPSPAARAAALASISEDEGQSLVLPVETARRLGYPEGPAMRRITLDVPSSLEGVGLTAAVAQALAEAGIACNMVAGFHHDHVFVPEADAGRALDLLRARAALG